jgi:ATP/maltotriose-dependent transcriptional regulator MalT
VSNLAMAWTSPILGDFDGALRQASVSLEEFRGQDEPFWMALAVGSAGALETVVGRYDDALGHLRTARDLGERFDNAWLAAWSQVQQGILAVVRGRLEEARAHLDAALEPSMAARSTRSVTLCLAAFAQLAFAAGDPERAALLVGAAEGLRRRVGLRTWPMLRRGEVELVAQLRQALEADHFDEVFAAGARLNQREAVAAVRDQRGTSTLASWAVAVAGTQASASRRQADRPPRDGTSGPGWQDGVSALRCHCRACRHGLLGAAYPHVVAEPGPDEPGRATGGD